MIRLLTAFWLLIAGVWAIAAFSMEMIAPGQRHAVRSGFGCMICLIPTSFTLMVFHWVGKRAPEERLMAIFFGILVRMGTTLACGVVIQLMGSRLANETGLTWLGDRPVVMWLWILFFYLVTLGVETGLIYRTLPQETKRQSQDHPRVGVHDGESQSV